MTLDEQKALERLNSPANLANRFARSPSGGTTSQVSKPDSSYIPTHRPDARPEPQQETEVKESLDTKGSLQIVQKNQSGTSKRLPQFMRESIAVLARTGGQTNVSIAKSFGVSSPEVGYLKDGTIQAVNTKKVEKAVKNNLDAVRDLALSKLMQSLGLLNDDKLSACTAPQLASISASMSTVVEKFIPRDPAAGGSGGVNLILYAPATRAESHYKVIEV